MKRANDPIRRPAHYTFAAIEPLAAIMAWGLNFPRGCVVKYVVRAGRKDDELEDLEKARECLDREIARVRAQRGRTADEQTKALRANKPRRRKALRHKAESGRSKVRKSPAARSRRAVLGR